MSLIFEDPEKYQELLERIKEEEKLVLEESLKNIKNLTDPEIIDFLKNLGEILHLIRLSKNKTLRDFIRDDWTEENHSALRVSEIERGLRLPNSNQLKSYLKILSTT